LENEKSYFQAEFRNFKNSESGKAGKNRMRNLILCDLKKNGPDSSSEAKVMVVLSLDSESGFLARCWKGGGFGFVDRVGFRYRIYFVDRVGCRDMIYFVDRVGFRDRICFVYRVGFVGWKRMDRIKLNQNKSKPATKLNLEHKLRTADSKTELCKG
jgi:hypothetical protein